MLARYFIEVNGVTELNLTKLDVLNTFPKIKIGVGYRLGKMSTARFSYPFTDVEVLTNVEVDYVEFDGWMCDISNITEFSKLPRNCRRYIHKIEELCDQKATFIGVGPRRDQMIMRE